MRWLGIVGLLVAAVALVGRAGAGPVEGSRGQYVKIEKGEKKQFGPERFKGGERACVILKGDHDPVMDLAIIVRDENGRVVAEDEAGGDICAVVWYPAVTASYTIVIENRGGVWNKCWFVMK
jgi:hypothetical protein